MASGPTEAAVVEALRGVMDPELHKDLVTLGLAKNIEVRDGAVSLLVALTTPARSQRETIEKGCSHGACQGFWRDGGGCEI